ncbi:MAG: hypothetical protein ACR2JW_13925 [Thermomicrobiales bacterium]
MRCPSRFCNLHPLSSCGGLRFLLACALVTAHLASASLPMARLAVPADGEADAAGVAFLADGVHFKAGWTLRLAMFGRGPSRAPVGQAIPIDDGARISYLHGNVTEWYLRQGPGIEQGMTLASPPPGDGPLSLAVATPGADALVNGTGDAATLLLPGGRRLRYDELRATDATGHALPAHLTQAPGGIDITVADEDAVYPLTVDPYIAEQTLTDPADTASDFFGFVMAMSGDGGILAIGSRIFSTGAGVVYIYTRSGSGYALAQTLTDPGANPGVDAFGNAVALTADGTTLVVGSPGAGTGGAAYVYTGSNGAFPATPAQSVANPSVTLDQFGRAVAVDNATSTLVVGAPNADGNKGAAYVFAKTIGATPAHGQPATGSVSPQVAGSFPATPTQTFTDPGNTSGDHFGQSAAMSGDGNTMVLGAPGSSGGPKGGTYITKPSSLIPFHFFSPPAPPPPPPPPPPPDSLPVAGGAVTSSADGGTMLVGSPVSRNFKGVVLVYMKINGSYTTPAVLTNPGTNGDQFGFTVAVSGDGNTIVVGTRGTSTQPGAAYVYRGSGGSFPATPTQTFTDPAHTNNDLFGVAVAVSNDGTTLLIGAGGTNGGRGVAYAFTLAPAPNPLPIPLPAGAPAPGGPPVSLPPARPSGGDGGVPSPLPPPRP